MKVLSFIAKNWNDILVVALLIISAITGLTKWVKRNGPIFKEMTMAERIAYITRLLTNLTPIALVLVTDAEIQFGGGTGQLKRSYVIDELYKRIPDEYKKYITEDNLDTIINKALEDAGKLWTHNPDVAKIVYGNKATLNSQYSNYTDVIAENVVKKLQSNITRGQNGGVI